MRQPSWRTYACIWASSSAARRDDTLDALLVLRPRIRRAEVPTAVARHRAVELEQLERLVDLALRQVDGALERRPRHRVDAFERGQDLLHVDGRRERRVA